MPYYFFEEENGNIIEKFFHMDDVPKIGEKIVTDNGYLVRIASFPFIKESSPKDIYNIDKLSQFSTTNETIGDTMKRSEEFSKIREEQNGGVDPIKRKFFDNYSKKRNGKKHPKDI